MRTKLRRWSVLSGLLTLILLGFTPAGSLTTFAGKPGGSTVQKDILGSTGQRHFLVQDTAATAHVLPKNGLHLVRVSLFGGAHVGSLIINWISNKYAHFTVSLSGQADYDVDWAITGNNLASAIFTTDGTAPTTWTLTFAETSWGGPPIDTYLAIRTSVTLGGAQSTIAFMSAVNFDAGESIPIGVQAYMADAVKPAAVYFPGESGFVGGANAQDETFTFPAPFVPAPVVKPANSITMGYTGAAAGLLTAYIFYSPTGGKK